MTRKSLTAGFAGIALATTLVACSGSSSGTTAGGTTAGSTSAGGGSTSSSSAVPGAGGGGGSGATNCTNKLIHADAPTVSVWAWYPNMAKVVDFFNNAHTDVQVCWTNAGQGQPEYAKFQTTIAAKKGAPDVIMLEADQLPGFEIQDALVDLSPYGAGDVKKNFSAGAWKDVSQGSAVFAIPVDGGPMAMIYRKDLFDKYKVAIPTTWAEYAAAAQKMKDAGGPLFGDLGSNVPAATTALFQQKGAQTFKYDLADKANVSIKLDDQPTKDVLNFWADLVKKGLVGTQDQFTTDYISGVIAGKYATYVSAAWAPGYLSGAGVGKGRGEGPVRGSAVAAVGSEESGLGQLGRVDVRGDDPGQGQEAGRRRGRRHLRRQGLDRRRVEVTDDLPAEPDRVEQRRVHQQQGRLLQWCRRRTRTSTYPPKTPTRERSTVPSASTTTRSCRRRS